MIFGRVLRTLRRSPGFLAASTLSLGAGLGIATATFAFVDTILHPVIPFAESDNLYFAQLWLGTQKHGPSAHERAAALRTLPGVESVGIAKTASAFTNVNGATARRFVATLSAEFIAALRPEVTAGRSFSAQEAQGEHVALVSMQLWHERFPGRDSIGDATLTIGEERYRIVGVVSPGAERGAMGTIWIPAASPAAFDKSNNASILLRLKPETSAAQLAPALDAIAARFTRDYVRTEPPYRLTVHPMRRTTESAGDFEKLLIITAFGVLTIACANVAAMMLARSIGRRRDIALRRALGASRSAVAGEVLMETAVISVAGTLIGLAVTIAAIGGLKSITPQEILWLGITLPELNLRVFAQAGGALVVALLVTSSIPAWFAARVEPSEPLKEGAGTSTGKPGRHFRWLVIAELAVALVLVVQTTLLVRSTIAFASYDFGYDARQLVEAEVSLPVESESLAASAREQMHRAVLDRIRSDPGVTAAAEFSRAAPDGEQVTSDQLATTGGFVNQKRYASVGPDFFRTTGIRLIEGRDFDEGDRASGGAVILSQRIARTLFPAGRAIGSSVRLGGYRSREPWLKVVGIVADVQLEPNSANGVTPEPTLFAITRSAAGSRNFSVVARRATAADAQLTARLQATLHDALPPNSGVHVASWLQEFDYGNRIQWFVARVFAFFGVAGLLLSAAGMFAVLTYAVSRRSRELAVRSALGASPRQLLGHVLHDWAEWMLTGTAIGTLLSFWSVSVISGVLAGVKANDLLSWTAAEGLLIAVTLLAALVPGARAMKADPVEVLRAT